MTGDPISGIVWLEKDFVILLNIDGKSKYLALIIVLISIINGCKKEKATTETTKKTETAKETVMGITIKWLGHASFKISSKDKIIYIDPWKLKDSPQDATLVLVSHSHYDHYSDKDIDKTSCPDTKLIASADVINQHGKGQTITPGQTIELNGIKVAGVPAYNISKQFHPKSNNWVGFIIELDSKHIYYAGDTDLTDEMKALKDIDIALLPVGGTYTMDAKDAAEAIGHIKPKQAIPYHWGDIVGSRKDADRFAELAQCEVTVMSPGESINIE